jgi:hypothetical protein
MKRKKEKRKKRVSKWYDVAKKQIDSENGMSAGVAGSFKYRE